MAAEKQSKATSSNTSGTTSNMADKAFSGIANLIKLLPTGTVFLFQFLSPVLTNSGHCSTINKYLAGLLLTVCGFSCSFSCFTDTYTGQDGRTYYGVATKNGLWVVQNDLNASSVDLSRYKLRIGDFAHAFLSVIVFGVLALLDPNTVDCYYPSFESNQKALLMVLPPIVGALSSVIYMIFPSQRHGIGYPSATVSQ